MADFSLPTCCRCWPWMLRQEIAHHRGRALASHTISSSPHRNGNIHRRPVRSPACRPCETRLRSRGPSADRSSRRCRRGTPDREFLSANARRWPGLRRGRRGASYFRPTRRRCRGTHAHIPLQVDWPCRVSARPPRVLFGSSVAVDFAPLVHLGLVLSPARGLSVVRLCLCHRLDGRCRWGAS